MLTVVPDPASEALKSEVDAYIATFVDEHGHSLVVRNLLRDCARRGMTAPVLAVGDGATFPKAVAKITDDVDELLAFYDYPAEHWIHLRTTKPIESTFATLRHRTKVTKGPGSWAAGLVMAFKLIESAQSPWRAVNAPHLAALVRAGAAFATDVPVERPHEDAA